jgi:hypothetical protein
LIIGRYQGFFVYLAACFLCFAVTRRGLTSPEPDIESGSSYIKNRLVQTVRGIFYPFFYTARRTVRPLFTPPPDRPHLPRLT